MRMYRLFFIILFLCITVIATSSVPKEDFDTAYKKLVPDDNAIYSLERILKGLGKIESDKRLKDFIDFFEESMESFDFQDIYESEYLYDTGKGTRAMCVIESSEADRIKLTLVPPDYDKYAINNLGDYIAEYALKKNETTVLGHSRSYSSYLRSKSSWKHFSYKNLLALFDALFKIIDPANIKKLDSLSSPLWCNISGDSRPILDEFSRSFPNFSTLLNKYFIMESAFTVKKYNNIAYTHADLKAKINYAMLEKDYPDFAVYLKKLNGVLEAALIMKTVTDHTWSKQIIYSDGSLKWDFYTHAGKLIPFDSNGVPVFQEEFSFSTEKNIIFTQIQKLKLTKFGLVINGENILNCEYHSTASKGTVSARLADTKGKVSGKAFGIFSPAFIDIMMPGTMDQLISNFAKVLLNANNGEGTVAKFEWDSSRQNDEVSHFLASTEILDNFLMRLGMKVGGGSLKLNDDEKEQIRNFNDAMTGAMLTDIKNKNELFKSGKYSKTISAR